MESSIHHKRRISSLALLLAVTWNLLILFLLFLAIHKEKIIIPPVAPRPVFFLDEPIAKPTQQQADKKVKEEQEELAATKQSELAVLVTQLISHGTTSEGAVVFTETPEDTGVGTATAIPPTSRSEPTPSTTLEPIQSAKELSKQKHKEKNIPLVPTPSGTSIVTESIKQLDTTATRSPSNAISSPQQRTDSHAQQRTPQNSRQDKRHKQLTLADLAHSFMKQVHTTHESTYHSSQYDKNLMSGAYSPTSARDSKELAMQMYCSKVFALIQQSMNTQHSLTYAHNDFSVKTTLELAIDKDGRAIRIQLNPALEEKDFEHTILNGIKRVGLFPPLPKHFDTEVLTATFPISIVGKKGFGNYSLSYSVTGN